MISSPRVERSPITFATDVTDCGVGTYPCSALLVITLIVRSHLVAFGLISRFACVASAWVGCECPATEAGSGDGWHGLGVGASGCCLDHKSQWLGVAGKGVEPPRTYRYGGWFPYPRYGLEGGSQGWFPILGGLRWVDGDSQCLVVRLICVQVIRQVL